MTSARRPQLDGRVLRLLPFFLVVLVALSAWRLSRSPAPRAPGPGPEMSELRGETMGTTFSIKLAERLSREQRTRVEAGVNRALAAVEQTMSTYRADSELSRFNQYRVMDSAFPISHGLREVMAVALQVGKASGGALDVTVSPIVDAWGFGPTPRDDPPAAAELTRLLAHVGLAKVALTAAGLVKRDPEVRCDLSAVAKGYAVDLVADRLSALGLSNYLIEVGGELRVRGRRPDGSLFRVGIEHPVPGARTIERTLAVHDQAIATSGDYRNFFMDGGQRRSHLIDPRTARPVAHGLSSVTVLHERAAVADAWATALLVLGPERGPALARNRGLAALFVVRDGEAGFRSLETPVFAEIAPNNE